MYLLTTNIPRPLVYLSKYAAALLLTLGMALGGLGSLCLVPGKIGLEALGVFWTVTACATAAYVGLFLLFSAWVRRATFLSLAYALMIETLTGNIPGFVKRITVSFYAKSWLYESGEPLGLAPKEGVALSLFDPVSAATAQWVLGLASAGLASPCRLCRITLAWRRSFIKQLILLLLKRPVELPFRRPERRFCQAEFQVTG